jgi:hypothetical protein
MLFWHYKDVDLCANRLRHLRKENPGVPVFGLYGGAREETAVFRRGLEPYLDDFYAFPDDRPEGWKWRHGDLLISRWYRDRGAALGWDTVFVVQWDMAVLKPLPALFPTLGQDEVLLSGIRPISEVESWWFWTQGDKATEFHAFCELVRKRHPGQRILACQFVVVCLSRAFLDFYSAMPDDEPGFLEYRVPTLADAFGIPINRTHGFWPAWPDEPGAVPSALSTGDATIGLPTLTRQMLSGSAPGIVHPYVRPLPLGRVEHVRMLAGHFVDRGRGVLAATRSKHES